MTTEEIILGLNTFIHNTSDEELKYLLKETSNKIESLDTENQFLKARQLSIINSFSTQEFSKMVNDNRIYL